MSVCIDLRARIGSALSVRRITANIIVIGAGILTKCSISSGSRLGETTAGVLWSTCDWLIEIVVGEER